MLVVKPPRDLLERVRGVVLIVPAFFRLLDDGQIDLGYFRLDKLKFRAELRHDVYSALVCINAVLGTIGLRRDDCLRVPNNTCEVRFAVKRNPFDVVHVNDQQRVKRIEAL